MKVQELQTVSHAGSRQLPHDCHHVAGAEAKFGILPRGCPPVAAMTRGQLGTHAYHWLHTSLRNLLKQNVKLLRNYART